MNDVKFALTVTVLLLLLVLFAATAATQGT